MARAAKKKTPKARKKAVKKPSSRKATPARKRKAPARKKAISKKKGKGITIARQKSVARTTSKPGHSNGKPLSQKQILRDALVMANDGLEGFDSGDLRAARRNLRFLVDLLSSK